ncbi:tyrosine-type recombinase/integrase [Sphingorhabdus sp.]|uniref:tyrosine-type recombinase/integrase n=1 Tax=Sphingorhabdus sp. TaxID=1902408 RepID=UPI0038FC818D
MTVAKVNAAKTGRHFDGQVSGLHLYVRDTGSRSWVLRLARTLPAGKILRRDFGLGSPPDIGVADARIKARQWREWWRQGFDPVAYQIASDRAAAAALGVGATTFREASDAYFLFKSPKWRNGKHVGQWQNTIAEYVLPHIGDVPVNDIDSAAIVRALSPIWTAKPETARRVRQRIFAVLEYSQGLGWRSTGAPRGAVKQVLDSASQPSGSNFSAVDYDHAPDVYKILTGQNVTVGRQALMFTILTAARSGETRGATWAEIDLDKAVWTIPANRMKAKKEHVQPLNPAAVGLLRSIQRKSTRPDELIFAGKGNRPLSDATMAKAQKEVAPNTTVHGWRATFRTWAADKTNFTRDIAEKALAHTLKDETEKSYNRGGLLEKRSKLLFAWGNYLEGRSNIAALPNKAKSAA